MHTMFKQVFIFFAQQFSCNFFTGKLKNLSHFDEVHLSLSMSDERKLIDHETKRNIPFLMGMVTKLVTKLVHNDMTLLEK